MNFEQFLKAKKVYKSARREEGVTTALAYLRVSDLGNYCWDRFIEANRGDTPEEDDKIFLLFLKKQDIEGMFYAKGTDFLEIAHACLGGEELSRRLKLIKR